VLLKTYGLSYTSRHLILYLFSLHGTSVSIPAPHSCPNTAVCVPGHASVQDEQHALYQSLYTVVSFRPDLSAIQYMRALPGCNNWIVSAFNHFLHVTWIIYLISRQYICDKCLKTETILFLLSVLQASACKPLFLSSFSIYRITITVTLWRVREPVLYQLNSGGESQISHCFTHASRESGQPNTFWRVYPKQLTGECGWNYIISYGLPTFLSCFSVSHISRLEIMKLKY